jgi:hypothetical protein
MQQPVNWRILDFAVSREMLLISMSTSFDSIVTVRKTRHMNLGSMTSWI